METFILLDWNGIAINGEVVFASCSKDRAAWGLGEGDNPSILPLEWLSGKMKELAAF
jgi:hypothetical protein